MRFILYKKSEFIINDTMLYPLGGGGKFGKKIQDRTISKNNNPGLVFY